MKFVWPTLLKSKYNEVGVDKAPSQNKFNDDPAAKTVTDIGTLMLSQLPIV